MQCAGHCHYLPVKSKIKPSLALHETDMTFSASRPIAVFVALLLALLAFTELGTRKLADPDEGRYSEIAREMAMSNDFITPRLNALKYFEKPPLQYWATAISFKVFGESEFSARLYIFLCALGCVLLIGYTAARLYGGEAGVYVALTLVGAWYFTVFTQIVTLDVGLTFWMTMGVCGFMIAQSVQNDASRRRWMLIAWTGMAGAVLSKGLIGIVFPSAAIFFYCLTQRDWRRLAKLEWFYGLALFFVITVPWHVAVSLQNPEFPQFYFVHEHFERFLTASHRRGAPWWSFAALAVLGLMPWGLALFPAISNGWRNAAFRISKTNGTTFAPVKFALIFSGFVLLFFSLSSSKLPGYILPIMPFLALAIGLYFKNVPSKTMAWLILPTLPLALAGIFAVWRDTGSSQMMMAGLGVWAFAVAIACVMLARHKKLLALQTMAVAMTVMIMLIARGVDTTIPNKITVATAEAIKKYLTPETRLYAIKIYDQSLPFNLKRTMTLVEYVDEFEMGQRAEPTKHIASINDLPASWNAPGAAIAIIQPTGADELTALGLNFEIIYQDQRRVAIRKL